MSAAIPNIVQLQNLSPASASVGTQAVQPPTATPPTLAVAASPSNNPPNQQNTTGQHPSASPPSFSNAPPPTSGIPVPQGQSSSQLTANPRHESIFHFRSERAQWLAMVAILISLGALVLTWVYSEKSLELAKWESEKDFYEHCQDLKISDQRLSRDCSNILGRVLPPPPGHSLDFFSVALSRIRRMAVNIATTEAATGNEDFNPSALVYIVIFGATVAYFGWMGWYVESNAQEIDAGPETKTENVIAIMTPVILRFLTILIHFCLGNLGPSSSAVLILCWTVGHIWAIYSSLNLLGSHYSSILHIWATWGLINGIYTDSYSSLTQLFLRILSLVATLHFSNDGWFHSMEKKQSYPWTPDFTRRVWITGYYITQIGGVLFLRDSIWGCSVLGMSGLRTSSSEATQSTLPIIIIPNACLFGSFFIAMFYDIFRPIIRHYSRRCFALVRRLFLALWMIDWNQN